MQSHDALAEVKHENRLSKHTSMLRETIANRMLYPLESDNLWCLSEDLGLHERIKNANTETQYKEFDMQWREQFDLLTQLHSSLKSCSNELKSETGKLAKRAKKKTSSRTET